MLKTIISIGLFITIMITLITLSFSINKATCSAQWGKSGMQYSWGPIQGCMLELADKTWIPADQYRNVTSK